MDLTDHSERLLAEKDEKIRLLEGHASAYTARISVLQNRLLTALDTLDSAQLTHNRQIAALEEKMAHLKDQLYRHNEVVKQAEDDLSDMRDAVMELVEKVEASNGDYSSWPHSRIHVTHLEDPMELSNLKPTRPLSEDDLLSYAASMIEALRKERDDERRSHAHIRVAFEARLVALEAQLSRREAELATCAHHIHRDIDEHLSQEDGAANLKQDIVDSGQIISVLDVTVARNKVLEAEIKALAKRLETARANQRSSSASSPKPGQAAMNSGSEGPRVNAAPTDDPDAARRTQLKAVEPVQDALRELDRDIRRLGEKVEAFSLERDNIRQILQTPTSNEALTNGENENIKLQRRIQTLEHECDQLRVSQQTLRDELDRARADARAREEQLLEEITTLKLDQDETERVPVAALLDENDGEISMELATPLMPMSVMPTSSTPVQDISISRTPSPAADPPDLVDDTGHTTSDVDNHSRPVPPSPRSASDPSDIASPTSEVFSSNDRSPASLPSQLISEIVMREEAQLIDMRRQVEAGEASLGELLELIQELNS